MSEPTISTLADLLAVAYRIEADAVERYNVLADQMQMCNNAELAAIFRDLARAEGLHAEEIRKLAGDLDLVEIGRRLGNWKGDSPEEVDLGAAHYMMTPWHALQLSLVGEKRALEFFTSIVNTASDPKVKDMAAEFVEEEAEHVNLVYRLLRKYPQPRDSWSDDSDAPVAQD
ncbi:MAG: ferritin family protein [Hyphomicrobiales bacterium]|nr:ferritin family protein [Hyphomicrobiales bacterium]